MAGHSQIEKAQESSSSKKPLKELFTDLRSCEDCVDDFLTKYEGIKVPKDESSRKFCQSYVIELLKTYCKDTKESSSANVWTIGSKEDKVELLLATFGLLDGYEHIKKLGQREMKYYEAAHSYNQLLKPKRERDPTVGTIIQNFITISNALADELEITLNEEMKKNNGVLGLIGKVPTELTLPKPRSFSHTIAKDQDMQNELKDSTEAIPDSTQEATADIKNPDSPQSVKSETFSEEIQSDTAEKPPQPPPQDPEEKSKKGGNGHEDESPGKNSHTEQKFDRFYIAIIATLTVISVIAVVAFAIALIAIIQRDDAPREAVSYPITIPYLTPAQQSCSLPVEGIVANNDGPIRLYPGVYTYIDVDVDPPEARYSLKYISENQDAVGVSDGRIYAYENYAPASGALFEEVTIWIKPIKPASPEVETKVSVIVNYTKSMDELKHFAGSEVTSNISEPIS